MASGEGVSQAARREAAAVLTAAGLPVHDVVEEACDLETLGLHLRQNSCTCTLNRRWKLRQAARAVLARPFLTGEQLEVLLGHYTFAFLLRRCCLSVFRASYTHVQRYYKQRRRLWSSVQRELETAASLLLLVESRFDLPWSTLVTVSDAAVHGCAVFEAEWSKEDVEAVGRISERWRFRKGSCRPRQEALRAWA